VAALETLNEFSLSLTASRSVEETLAGGEEDIVNLLRARSAAVFMHNEKARTLAITVNYKLPPVIIKGVMARQPFRLDDGPDDELAAVEAFRRQAPYTVNDMAAPGSRFAQRWAPYVLGEERAVTEADAARVGVRSLVALPLS